MVFTMTIIGIEMVAMVIMQHVLFVSLFTNLSHDVSVFSGMIGLRPAIYRFFPARAPCL